jgi:hypothetical protein
MSKNKGKCYQYRIIRFLQISVLKNMFNSGVDRDFVKRRYRNNIMYMISVCNTATEI